MSEWFTRRQAFIDAAVSFGAALAIGSWFGAVLGFGGWLALLAVIFGATQLVRFTGAQLATLEWAKLQEAGLPEKVPQQAIVPRGDGYREAGVIDEPPSADVVPMEAEIASRRASAHRSLAVVGTAAALATLVPGLAYGAWVVPVVLGALTAAFALFALTNRLMRRREARLAAVVSARKRVELEVPKVRVGVDFGVPSDVRVEADRDDAVLENLRG